MIELVTPENRGFYAPLIEDMYRLRYQVCIEQWGWDVPAAEPGRDKDQFDTDQTVYILHLDDQREHVIGCCRMNPTTGPTMMSELYADACDLHPVPCDPAIWESSRLVIAPELPRQDRYDMIWRLGIGLIEFGLTHGVDRLAWYTGPGFYGTIKRVMRVEPLGLPRYNAEDDETYFAAMSWLDEDALIAMRHRLADPTARMTYALAPIFDHIPDSVRSGKEAA